MNSGNAKQSKANKEWNRVAIEGEAKRLLLEIQKNWRFLSPRREFTPLRALEPFLLAQVFRVGYEESGCLSTQRFPYKGRDFKLAGLLDRQANRIVVSNEFGPEVLRFTGAHECFHYGYHHGEVMHRDMPLDGSQRNRGRPRIEREADYFAAVFLMPAEAVRQYFQLIFQTKGRFIFNGANAFEVCRDHPDKLIYDTDPKSLERERVLATCRSFRGGNFKSLAEVFRVSPMAMAIRLKELNLIEWP